MSFLTRTITFPFVTLLLIAPTTVMGFEISSECNEGTNYYLKKKLAGIQINDFPWSGGLVDSPINISKFLKSGKNEIAFSYNKEYDEVALSLIENCGTSENIVFKIDHERPNNSLPDWTIDAEIEVSILFRTSFRENYISNLTIKDKDEIKHVISKSYGLLQANEYQDFKDICMKERTAIISDYPEISKEFLDWINRARELENTSIDGLSPNITILKPLSFQDMLFSITNSSVLVYRAGERAFEQPFFSYKINDSSHSNQTGYYSFKKIDSKWKCIEPDYY